MRTLLLEKMTWPEIKQAMESGYKTVVIVVASIEQHGPHLAEETDTALGYAYAQALAERIGTALIAPVIRPGLSEHHMVLPATITLRKETLVMLMQDYVDSYVRHGFDTIVMMSSHGGNFATVGEFVDDYGPKLNGVKLLNALTLAEFGDLAAKVEKQYDLPSGACGGHACDFETSMMLDVMPGSVFMDKAVPGNVQPLDKEMTDRLFKHGVTGISEVGVLGDPTAATAERGKWALDVFGDKAYSNIKDKL